MTSGAGDQGGFVGEEWLRSGIGRSTPDSITVRGRNLATDLMGQVTFTELAFLLTAGRMPTAGETALFDAALVALADHGLTPSVLAARLTWTGATESLQGAVAAGLLGAGNVFLGVVDDTARFLAATLADPTEGAVERAVQAEIDAAATGKSLPINGAGVAGAAFADLGFPPAIVRGFALLARTAGIVGHLAEERSSPIGMPLY